MLTCKQVSKTLSNEDYENLSPYRKVMLKLHVHFCIFCGRFNRQVMDSQDMCRDYKKQEDSVADFRPKMDEHKKDQLKALLASESSNTKDND